MSELKRNLAANFRRYTDGRNKIEYLVKIAMYTAISFVLYAFVKFPLPFYMHMKITLFIEILSRKIF